jgi:hypothetical protein
VDERHPLFQRYQEMAKSLAIAHPNLAAEQLALLVQQHMTDDEARPPGLHHAMAEAETARQYSSFAAAAATTPPTQPPVPATFGPPPTTASSAAASSSSSASAAAALAVPSGYRLLSGESRLQALLSRADLSAAERAHYQKIAAFGEAHLTAFLHHIRVPHLTPLFQRHNCECNTRLFICLFFVCFCSLLTLD